MTWHPARVAVGVMFAVLAYTASIFALVAVDVSGLGVILMLAVCAGAAVLMRRHLVLLVAAVVMILPWSFVVAVAANIVTGHETAPFAPHCEGNWDDLIHGQECQGPPHGEDGWDPFPFVIPP